VIIRRLAKERLGIRKLARLKEHIRRNGLGFTTDTLERYSEMLQEFDITVLRDYASPRSY